MMNDDGLAAIADPARDQYFLVNEAKIRIILDAADVRSGDHVVEVGAGVGTIARHLPPSASLTLIELDGRLVPHLRDNAPPWATVIEGDALTIVAELDRVDVLLANLPTSVTEQLLPQLADRGLRVVVAAVGGSSDLSGLADRWDLHELTTISGDDFRPAQPAVSRLVRLSPLWPDTGEAAHSGVAGEWSGRRILSKRRGRRMTANSSDELQMHAIEQLWPAQVAALGPKKVKGIVNGSSQGEPVGDRRISYVDLVATIAAGAATIQAALAIWQAARTGPSSDELLALLKAEVPVEVERCKFDLAKSELIIDLIRGEEVRREID